MWKDKNHKLEVAYQKQKETTENHKLKIVKIEEETSKFKN